MNTASIKIKSYVDSAKNIDGSNLQARILDTMLFTIVILAIFYFLFLANMIWNIVERKSLENYASALSSEVGELELEYIALSERVDLSFAHSLGFEETEAKFANRKAFGSVGMVNNEI